MLWYKAWRETRTRLMLCTLTLIWLCAIIVIFQHQSRFQYTGEMTYTSYIWNAIYKDYVRNLFVMLAIVLGGGSLLQERAQGTVGFTLALPVGRARLVAVRAAVGIAEVAAVALVPAVVIPLFSRLVGEQYDVAQASQFAVLWIFCGILIFGLAHMLSAVLAGTYSAWIVSFLAILLYIAAVNITRLQDYPTLDFFKIMSGSKMSYFDSASHTITGPLPWLPLLVIAGLGVGCIAAAVRITERQDF